MGFFTVSGECAIKRFNGNQGCFSVFHGNFGGFQRLLRKVSKGVGGASGGSIGVSWGFRGFYGA